MSVTVRIGRVGGGGPDGVGETPTAGWPVDTTRASRLTVSAGVRRREDGLFEQPGFHCIEPRLEDSRSISTWFEVLGRSGTSKGGDFLVTVEDDDDVSLSTARYD